MDAIVCACEGRPSVCARARVCETERKREGFVGATRSCRALTTTGCCCCWRPPLLTGAQDGRHRSRRACAPRPSARQVVPAGGALRSAPRAAACRSRIFFSPDDPVDAGRDGASASERQRRGPRLHEPVPTVARPRHKSRGARACAPEYRYADRRVAARKAPEIPRPSPARPTV